jgi:protein O-GlcNAc transferase
MALLARRAAPVQVTWLGYAATSGAGRRGRDGADAPVDFLVADRVIVPPEHLAARYYSESVLYLPGSYQPQDEFQGADGPRAFPPPPPFPRERDEEGIPRSAFVLGCLQRTNKLDPDAFDDWMNALRMAPRAVLWLLSGHEDDAERNLRAEAAARGVNPRRLHFASRVDKAGYLERLARVDLFLDTRPYGAHTTAADAMWTTTPVLTMLPETRSGFASRVGASLVEATGLSGVLLAGGRGAYSATAARLARSPAVAHALRRRVGEVRGRGLFDSAAFAAKLERAWRCAWDAKGAGGKERHVVVGGGLATV